MVDRAGDRGLAALRAWDAATSTSLVRWVYEWLLDAAGVRYEAGMGSDWPRVSTTHAGLQLARLEVGGGAGGPSSPRPAESDDGRAQQVRTGYTHVMQDTHPAWWAWAP